VGVSAIGDSIMHSAGEIKITGKNISQSKPCFNKVFQYLFILALYLANMVEPNKINYEKDNVKYVVRYCNNGNNKHIQSPGECKY
jgi:hypothetical protein